MNCETIISSVFISTHEKLVSGRSYNLFSLKWENTAAIERHVSDIFVLFAFFVQFAAVIDSLTALTSWELLIAQIKHRVSFVTFNHTAVADESLVIAFHASVGRIRCAYICISVWFLKTVHPVVRLIGMWDIKELTNEFRNVQFLLSCGIRFVHLHDVTENDVCDGVWFGFDKARRDVQQLLKYEFGHLDWIKMIFLNQWIDYLLRVNRLKVDYFLQNIVKFETCCKEILCLLIFGFLCLSNEFFGFSWADCFNRFFNNHTTLVDSFWNHVDQFQIKVGTDLFESQSADLIVIEQLSWDGENLIIKLEIGLGGQIGREHFENGLDDETNEFLICLIFEVP